MDIYKLKDIPAELYNFKLVGRLQPKMENDKIWQDKPWERYNNRKNLPKNINGDGIFCNFKLLEAKKEEGVYLWVIEDRVIYIGETINLKERFYGYGNISPKNCFKGGRSTNCKMNKVALSHFKEGDNIDIYFMPTNRRKEVEKELLEIKHTPHNVKDNN